MAPVIKHILQLVVVLSLVMGVSSYASADLTTTAQLSGSFFGGTFPECNQLGTTSSSCSGTGTGAEAALFGTSNSTAAYTALGGFAQATDTSLASPGTIVATAISQSSDMLSVGRFHGPAFLTGTFNLDGTITGAEAFGFLDVTFDDLTTNHTAECTDLVLIEVFSAPSDITQCTNSLRVNVNDQVNMTLFLEVQAEAGAVFGTLTTADFSHTGFVSSLDLLDSSGIPITGASIVAASGTVYPSSVPEPSCILLLCSGLLAVIGAGKARFSH
jgi:hypothetical protein